MSAERELEYLITINSRQALEEARKIDEQTNKVASRWDNEARRIHAEMSRMVRATNGVLRVISASFRVLGYEMDPLKQAMINMINTTLRSLLIIHRTWESGTGGLSTVITLGLSASAIVMSAANVAETTAGIEQSQSQIFEVANLLDSLMSVSLPFTFGGGYFY